MDDIVIGSTQQQFIHVNCSNILNNFKFDSNNILPKLWLILTLIQVVLVALMSSSATIILLYSFILQPNYTHIRRGCRCMELKGVRLRKWKATSWHPCSLHFTISHPAWPLKRFWRNTICISYFLCIYQITMFRKFIYIYLFEWTEV